jgi:hypothetical protein
VFTGSCKGSCFVVSLMVPYVPYKWDRRWRLRHETPGCTTDPERSHLALCVDSPSVSPCATRAALVVTLRHITSVHVGPIKDLIHA